MQCTAACEWVDEGGPLTQKSMEFKCNMLSNIKVVVKILIHDIKLIDIHVQLIIISYLLAAIKEYSII
jgi:hypothetical protein